MRPCTAAHPCAGARGLRRGFTSPPRCCAGVWGEFVLLSLLLLASPCHQLCAGDSAGLRASQVQRARRFSVYDFEPRPGQDDSRDADFDGLPDYWTKVEGPLQPEYEALRIVEDPWRPGADPATPGHVLYMTYSGATVAAETVIPREVDPQLAYEISVYARTRGLDNSLVSVDIVWLRIDETGQSEVLGQRDQILIPPGQRDWPEAPLVRRVNDVDRRATHVRLVCRVRDNPEIPGADRHGEAWFDDIRILSRPKIAIAPVFREDDKPLRFIISYQGLKSNAGREGASGRPVRKEYHRRIEVRDVQGRQLGVRLGPRETLSTGSLRPLPVGESQVFIEEVELQDWLPGVQPPARQKGIFYVQVILYGAERQPVAGVTEVVGRWAPARTRPILQRKPQALDNFGFALDPANVLGRVDEQEVLAAVRHLGIYRAKVEMWGHTTDGSRSDKELQDLDNLLRGMRAAGVRFTGVFGALPSLLIPTEHMLGAMRERTEALGEAIQQPVLQLGPQIDDWQWGADDDPSFGRQLEPAALVEPRRMLGEITSAFSQALPITLGSAPALPEARVAEAVTLHVPAALTAAEMVPELVPLVPERFLELIRWERDIYPPERIAQAASRARARVQNNEASRAERAPLGARGLWLNLQPLPLDAHLRDLIAERSQVILLARKAVLSRVFDAERVTLGALADPHRGLMAVSRDGHLVPRPSFLAVRTLADHLIGAEYVGSLMLGNHVENYVFRSLQEPEKTILAAWYAPPRGAAATTAEVDIGIGWGKLERVDMAGNRVPVRKSFTVGAMPVLLVGLPTKAVRTRMSIRILPEPPLLSVLETQRQRLQIRNFHTEPLVGTIRLVYAASLTELPGGERRIRLEPGWTSPAELRINLPAGGEAPAARVEARRWFDVRPTPESVMGRKLVRLEVQLAAASELRYKLLRPTAVTSDLSMRVHLLAGEDRPTEHVVRLTVNWAPDPSRPHPPRLTLKPYYQAAGDQHTYQGLMTVYPVKAADDWSGAAIRDLRIPRAFVGRGIWVGVDEDGGSRFLRQSIKNLFPKPGGGR